MKKLLAPIILIILFISIVSAIAIISARGLTFTRNEVLENGILEINSNPQEAKIYINDELKGTTPERLELPEGSYNIKLTKDNYTDWNKEFKLEGSILTKKNITLYPVDLNLEQISFTNIHKASFTPDNSLVTYIIKEGKNKGIWTSKIEKNIFDLSNTTRKKISDLKTLQDCNNKQDYQTNTTSDNKHVLVSCTSNKVKYFYLLSNSDLENTKVTNLNKKIGFNPIKITFGKDNILFIEDKAILITYNINTDTTKYIIRKQSENFLKISPFGENMLILYKDYNKENKLALLDQNLSLNDINITSEKINLEDVVNIYSNKNNNKAYILNTNKDSFIISKNNLTIKKLDKRIDETLAWNKLGTSLVFISKNNLYSLLIKETPDNTHKATFSSIEKKFDKSTSTVKFSNSSEQILIYYSKKEKLFAMDIDGRNTRLLYEGDLAQKDSFAISPSGTFLVLLIQDQEDSSNLYTLKLKV